MRRTSVCLAPTPISPSPHPYSKMGRGVGVRVRPARDVKDVLQDVYIALRPNPHPPLGTLSRRERDSLRISLAELLLLAQPWRSP
jgi:hypothetical protein